MKKTGKIENYHCMPKKLTLSQIYKLVRISRITSLKKPSGRGLNGGGRVKLTSFRAIAVNVSNVYKLFLSSFYSDLFIILQSTALQCFTMKTVSFVLLTLFTVSVTSRSFSRG